MGRSTGVQFSFSLNGVSILQTIDEEVLQDVAPQSFYVGAPAIIEEDEYTMSGFEIYPGTKDQPFSQADSKTAEGVSGSYRTTINVLLKAEQ